VLAGLGAVAVPVAIHLLNKMRVQVVRWGAMRFIEESVKKNQRRLRVEDLLLLVLRCLLLALLAFAFARPVIHPEAAITTTSGPGVMVLLVDQSAGMGQSDGVRIRFDQAKAAANNVLDGLGADWEASLFLVTDRVNQVISRPTANLSLVRHALDVAQPSDRISDLLPGVRLAVETLRPFTATKKEIVLFTDDQAIAWKQVDAVKSLLANAPDIHFQVVPIGGQGEDNLAITSLRPDGGLPAAGQIFGCLAEVTNFSPQPATGIRVTISLNGDAPADQVVIDRIEPWQARTVRLNVRFAQAGFQTLTASIPPDRLPVDNRRSIAVRVVDEMHMTIIEGGQAEAIQDRDGFFLANALVPVPPANRAAYYLKVDTAPPSWLEDADLRHQELVALCNAPPPSAAACKRLLQFVSDGGALLIFPGPNIQPADYNNNADLSRMMPATFGALREPDKNGSFASWQAGGYSHPVTALWQDPRNGSLGSVRASKFFPLIPAPAKTAAEAPHAIVNYSDGSPAVIERTFGRGHVVMFSSTAATQWTNLPIHPDFIPFLRRLTGYVARDGGEANGALNLEPGAIFQHAVNLELAGREFSVAGPDPGGKPQPAGRVELVDRQAVVRCRDTEKTGAYRVFVTGEDQAVAAFAVRMDPRESDLRVIPDETLAGLRGGDNTPFAGAAPKAMGPVRREFWGWCVWLAACIALAEMTLAHRFSLAK
jgi:hypothetical protein